MKYFIIVFLLITSFYILSCSNVADSNDNDFEWIKIEIPNEGSVYSFYGSIENTLIIGTLGGILKSVDYGNNWQKVYQPDYSIRDFIIKDDTLFAITNFDDYFSSDDGQTWYFLYAQLDPEPKDYIVTTSTGIMYKIVERANGELAQPTLVLRSEDSGDSWEDIFPFNHYIYSIYLDEKDRLYLGINGWQWNEESGSFDPNTANKAIIYYLNSKN